MLSKEVFEGLNDQVRAEIESAYKYLSMSIHADNENWEGMSAWLYAQAREEMAHAHKLVKYIGARGESVRLLPLAQPESKWDSPLALFEEVLKHEQYVTTRIHGLADVAHAAKDYATQEFLLWYIGEQVEEEATVSVLVEKLRRIGDNVAGLMVFDSRLKQERGGHVH